MRKFNKFRKDTPTLTDKSLTEVVEWKIPRGAEIERQLQLIGLTKSDLAFLKVLKPLIIENIDSILDGFYANITKQPNLKQIIDTFSSIDRLKKTFHHHILEMFDGEIDKEFIEKRVRIAHAHVKIGLNTKWYMSAFQNLLNSLLQVVEQHIENHVDLINAVKAITKLLNLEQQLVLEAFEEEMERVRNIQEEKNRKILQLGDTAESLAAIAEETSASIEYLNSQSINIASLSKIGLELSEQAEMLSNKGMDHLKKSHESILLTKDRMDIVVKHSAELERIAKQITEIVSIIQSISDQTALLSLNASIESSRAGEYGRGFSVVANEIRKLSSQTKKSISDVSTLISETNEQIYNVTSSIYEVGDILQDSSDIIRKTNLTFEEIIQSMLQNKQQNNVIENEINAFTVVISEISSGSTQVANIADQLNSATQEINR